MTLEELEEYANTIPSMGGTKLGPFLDHIIEEVEPRSSIVEVGSWLGAGTAQIALSLFKKKKQEDVEIHVYDRWQATASEVAKSNVFINSNINVGDDTLVWVKDKLQPFDVKINFHKGDISDIEWKGGPISIYIDDAAKSPDNFFHILKTFGPSWIPGKTVLILMDFYMWKKKFIGKFNGQKCQTDFVSKYSDYFKKIEDFRKSYDPAFSNEAFLYTKKLDFNSIQQSFYPLYHVKRLKSKFL